jgi:hypothetical protein
MWCQEFATPTDLTFLITLLVGLSISSAMTEDSTMLMSLEVMERTYTTVSTLSTTPMVTVINGTVINGTTTDDVGVNSECGTVINDVGVNGDGSTDVGTDDSNVRDAEGDEEEGMYSRNEEDGKTAKGHGDGRYP